MFNPINPRPMKSIKSILLLVVSFALLLSCSLKYTDIAGSYTLGYSYSFSGPGFTGNTYTTNGPTVVITQTDDIITVSSNPGTIDKDDNITITGDIVEAGNQTFNGSLNKDSGVITGTLSGTAQVDIWVGYNYQSYTVSITSGTCTLTPVN
jgi:hypothetical protein